MAGKKGKSRKRSYGKERNRPLKSFTIYLCHNLDFDEVAAALSNANVRFHRHRQFHSGWVSDSVLLPFVGRKKWILIIADQRQRTRQIENRQIRQYKIREFVLTSGNMSKAEIVAALLKAKNKMKRVCSVRRGPFIYSISKAGDVRERPLHGA